MWGLVNPLTFFNKVVNISITMCGYHTKRHRFRESLPILGNSDKRISFICLSLNLLNEYQSNTCSPLFIVEVPSLTTSKFPALMEFKIHSVPLITKS